MRTCSCLMLLALLASAALAPASAQISSLFPGRQLPFVDPALGSAGFELVQADIDVDGLPDVLGPALVYGPTSSGFVVLRGQQGGGFAPPQLWPLVGATAISLAVGDLDGDAWPDIIVGDSQQRIVVAHGTGGGSFGFSAAYFVGKGKPRHVAIVDVNHDGLGDLLSGTDSKPGWINVNLGDAVLGVLATQSWSAGAAITDMEVGDLNGDGWVDVVCCDAAADRLAVVRGDGAGGFLPAQLQVTADNPQDVLLGPLDADADLDVLLVSAGASLSSFGTVHTWLGDGLGGLSSGSAVALAIYPFAGVLHDLDDDGDLDAAIVTGDHRASLLVNDGTASFVEQQSVSLGSGLSEPLVFDVTGDGVRDLFGLSTKDLAALFPAAADGSFPSGSVSLHPTGYFNGLGVARVNGDDVLDLVFGATGSPTLGTLLGSTAGLSTTPVASAGYADSFALAVGDLDGDGRADVVSSAANPPRLQVGHGLGTGAFAPPQNLTWAGPYPARRLVLSDLDGDGWRDVVGLADSSVEAQVLAFANLGSAQPGTLGAPAIVGGAPFTYYLEVGDLDGDGDPDVLLLAGNAYSVADSSLNALLGDGDGGFAPGPITPVPLVSYDAIGLAVGDLDLDGRLDAVVGDADGRVAPALGDGAGGFQFGDWGTEEWSTDEIAVGDVDGDGWPDVLHAGYQPSSSLIVRRGDGAGGLQPVESYTLSDSISALVLADVTRDGRPDVIAASFSELPSVDSQMQFLPGIAEPFTWKDLGFALAGSKGEPRLVGTGPLLPGTPGFVRLSQAKPSAPCALFVSPTATPTPFKGGTLVPVPPLIAYALFTDANGRLDIPWLGWPSSHPGQSWYFQFGVQDSGGPHGAALSNAISGTEP